MNDPSLSTAQAGADKDEPPSWLKRIWAQAQQKLRRGKAEDDAVHEAVDELLEEAKATNGAPVAERVFLDNILSLRDKEAADCMVPRGQIIAIDVDSDMKDLVALMADQAHSRIPAYRETLDETVGMVHMKDVLACMATGRVCRIRDLLRPVLFAAPSMPASKLLLQMMQTRKHMAMVIDEFGGIDGLVTIEDLVEEIVGEIEDEHDDPPVPQIMTRPDGTLLVEASIAIEDFESRVGQLLDDELRETIDTLAGYVFHLAGHIPVIGETISGPEGIKFDVLETDQNRIKRVRVRGLKRESK